MTIYLNSYRPLCFNKKGRMAIQQYGIQPFVDHSVRREPDLEHVHPGISALCRAGKFAPKLQEEDVVVYMTVKRKYEKGMDPLRYLVAILRVIKKCDSHVDAANWYLSKGLTVPGNCMIAGSRPLPCNQTVLNRVKARLAESDYTKRSREFPQYLICESEHLNLTDPPRILDEDLTKVFGYEPGTQNPKKIFSHQLEQLRQLI